MIIIFLLKIKLNLKNLKEQDKENILSNINVLMRDNY